MRRAAVMFVASTSLAGALVLSAPAATRPRLAPAALMAGAQPGAAASAPRPRVAVRHELVLKVSDCDAAADTAIAAIEGLGGYFLGRSNEGVQLKVPVGRAAQALAALEPLGTVIQRTTQANDLGERLDEQRTRLAGREAMLQRYYAVLAAAGPGQVVEVEQTMTGLVQEIETLRGAIQLMEHQLRWADIAAVFQFRERRAPVADGRSSFAWLNTVNISDLIAEFGHDN